MGLTAMLCFPRSGEERDAAGVKVDAAGVKVGPAWLRPASPLSSASLSPLLPSPTPCTHQRALPAGGSLWLLWPPLGMSVGGERGDFFFYLTRGRTTGPLPTEN